MPKRIVSPEPRLLRGLRTTVRADLERNALDGAVVDDAVLCMHEACLNAMQHGRGPLHIRWEIRDGEVRFEVGDEGPGFELIRLDEPPPTGRQAGRGLFLIGRLADWLETGVRGPLHYVAFAVGKRKAQPPIAASGRMGATTLTGRLTPAASSGNL